ncbi:hypothetical protein GUITHDRAFT_119090 [Guillardia theta CCMP2712]|uniref:Uncharacterized protein n=2 Tax=Guillardia theta TaxID=55529 RepID=L1IFW5_GUITC|nr:hypothetical protein GUITHDRAFT_119090 [Guillardia theta CCMP2712]EKX34779.1 hypothetical protein GUITHDRAFT_119090 [Guillardia theta CCMP2712]|eukprot:XP_005821759.1 hypothetical protein GUITHDRAFT_119090 [Guillardia theta CCMP2712]
MVFDVVIICAATATQEELWQTRLSSSSSSAFLPPSSLFPPPSSAPAPSSSSLFVAVHEDWASSGAGNGLGSLYAYSKARDKAKTLFGVDLDDKLKSGWAAAIFHTAGKGTRLAPLPGSENNNKPGVKLPSLLPGEDGFKELTILEAVIRQTNAYAPVRKGRCSVFWGDQVFVPSAGILPSGSHHADILASLGPMPSEEEWTQKGLDKYGLIAVNANDDAAQVEKVSYKTANELLAKFGEIKQVGPSLGSFSVSASLLFELMKEFEQELKGKQAKFDSDPHFWMPLTLEEDTYVSVMMEKGETDATARGHYKRMKSFKERFMQQNNCSAILGCINVGNNCYWWDYGQLKLFQKNSLLVTKDSEEAKALREFLQIHNRLQESSGAESYADASSVILASDIKSGKIESSVCSRVTAVDVKVSDSILVNVVAKKIVGKNCILYNVVDDSEEGIVMEDGEVRADVFIPGKEKIVLRSRLDVDGGKAWKVKLDQNTMSFESVYEANCDVDVVEAQREMAQARAKVVF